MFFEVWCMIAAGCIRSFMPIHWIFDAILGSLVLAAVWPLV